MIEIKKDKVEVLEEQVNETRKLTEKKSNDLNKESLQKISSILSSAELEDARDIINKFHSDQEFSYERLVELEGKMQRITQSISNLKDEIDINIFLKDGYTLDIEQFRKRFKEQDLHKKFPYFDFERLLELYKYPPKNLKPEHETKSILVDPYVFRKLTLAIVQMVLDEMDIVWVVTGGEGTGKSTHVSELMYITHYILTEIKVIDYKLDIKECFFNTLENLRLKEDEYTDEKFRIFSLDEGNELHRQNWKDEEVQTFFGRIRRQRYKQRIKFICIPVLGELMLNLVMARINFITELKNKADLRTGGLIKGDARLYILPRSGKIYSPMQKRELTEGQIKSSLYDSLQDKRYLRGMPEDILIKKYKSRGAWGVPKDQYIKELKETEKSYTAKSDGIKLSEWESFCWYRANFSLKAQGISSKDTIYPTLNKSMNRLKKLFEEQPEVYDRNNLKLERKEGEKVTKKPY